MVLDINTQLPTLVSQGKVFLKDGRNEIEIEGKNIVSINPNNGDNSATYTTKTSKNSVVKVFIKDGLGSPIEPDATSFDYCIRIAASLDA